MADGGDELKSADGGDELKSADGRNADAKNVDVKNARSEVVRKPSRRSPTTGHRRKKTDLKRSQSSPREAIVPTSSDDEGRNVPVRRRSLSPGPGPEPKKVLRRRHRIKEKSQEPKDEASSLNSTTPKDQASKSGSIKTPAGRKDDNQKIVEPKIGNSKTPAAPKDENQEIVQASKVEVDAPKKSDRRKSNDSKGKPTPDVSDKNDMVKPEEKSTKDDIDDETKTDAKKDKASDDDCKEDTSTRPNSWWGGWSPFNRKEAKPEPASEVEATGDDVDQRGDDYMTTDDETAAEFVKLLSGNKTEIKDVAIRKPKLSVDDETTPLLGDGKVKVAKSWRQVISESRTEFAKYKKEFPKEMATLRKLRNRCFCELLIMFIFCGCGALIFKTTEGTFESFYKCGVKRVKRDFIDDLWRSSHFMKEEDWKSKARSKLWMFENQLQEAFEAGINTYSGQKSWSFINGIIYCLTVVTTIGYGHIAPVTNSGRALTIAYSIIGIPLFLILLADFGKLFTRCIKFFWAFVRRLYYTGSCKKVRRTGPVQEVMKGMQMMYDTIRRPSLFPQGADGAEPVQDALGTPGDAPSTPALSAFAIDDEFNLPISVAISILLVYIFMGATVFWCWEEDWTFFESFYFVFISMSTIGFGDLVPKNQMYMMLSIVYLAFGLALTSMCINVVQEKLSDSFRKASAKIGATIGLKVSDDDGTISPVSPTHVEIAEVHKSSIQSMLTPQHHVS